MAVQEKRSSARQNASGTLTGAPYLAKVLTHLDENYQGGLEVVLIRESGNNIGDESQTYTVKYSSPFYGVTPYEFTGENLTYDDSQQSYGFWGPPPDVGVTGIVIFIDGRADLGFWICSVQDTFQNHMIPAIAGSKNYKTTEDYGQGEHPLPVVEHNRKANKLDKNLEIDKVQRAVHPFAKVIKGQGLIRDEFRGTSTSTSRRDIPNMVFGMSSPGPLNRSSKKKYLGNKQSQTATPQPVNRLGGTQFVMDDGDDRYFRSTSASDGPPAYVKNPGGKNDIPYNEHFRIRTRTGHQILFHNSEDLIYINNAKGTAWIELTSDGKIDIFSADSINIRTMQDFNFRCDRDFNLEVGRNFTTKVSGEMYTTVVKDSVLVVEQDQKIYVKRRKDETIDDQFRQTVNKDVKIFYAKDYVHGVDGRMDLRVANGMSFTMGAGESKPGFAPFNPRNNDPKDPCSNDPDVSKPVQDISGPTPDRLDIKIFKDTRIQHLGVNVDHTIDGYHKLKIKGDQDINVTGHIYTTSGGSNETKAGGNIVESAPRIEMNPVSFSAATASVASLPEEARKTAKGTIPTKIKTHNLPNIKKSGDSLTDLETILRRIPSYEPYPHHEHLDPKSFKPEKLDRDSTDRYAAKAKSEDLRKPPASYQKYQKPNDNPF